MTSLPPLRSALLICLWLASTVIAMPAAADTKKGARKASPALASLPAPKATGRPLRILLVDDDWSSNSGPGARPSLSDAIFRKLATDAVGGDAGAWSVEMALQGKHGPSFERLRDFNVVVWYTGESYGGSHDGVATLSEQDETTVRRYLQEAGGTFILISPGFLSTRGHGATWTKSANPFLKEVVGVHGFASLVQRFAGSTVSTPGGASFAVQAKGAVETQFSAVNPDGAAVVFSASLDRAKTAPGPVAVAVAHPYGAGRFVYVGFSFENVAEGERAKAFGMLLEAATGPRTAMGSTPIATRPFARSDEGRLQQVKPPPSAPAGPPPANLEIVHSSSYAGNHHLRWVATLNTGINAFEVFRRDAGAWKFLKGGFRENFYDDASFVAPNSGYKVVAVYADGRRGEAVVEYPSPPQPQAPTGVKAVQTGAETVQVDWVNVPHVGKYRLYAPGSPAAGVPVATGTAANAGYSGRATLTNMPIGIHDVKVAAEYAPGVAPVHATVKIAVNSDRGRYRLLFLGVRVNTAVNDDILDFDGKGNEIYAAAFWATTHQTQSQPAAPGGFARTLVYGDTANFPARLRAGSAGASGGLRAGDSAPSANAQATQPGVAAQNDRFPLRLWEGELVDSGPIIAVIPIVFEWNAVNHSAWDTWANYWSQGGNTLQKLGNAMRTNLSAALSPQPLFGTWTVYDPTKTVFDSHEERPILPLFPVAADRDRPIGLINTSAPLTAPQYGHKTVGFTLTRKRAEVALAGQRARILQLPWSDAVSGGYTGYFQLERLSEPPLVAPASPAPAPTMTSSTIVIGATGAVVSPPATPSSPADPVYKTASNTDRSAGNQTIKPAEAPPPGPPPTQLNASSEHAARHIIRWQGGTGATFSVFRKQGDQWIAVADGTSFTQAVDESFVAPGTVYQVDARYPDGRLGRAEVTFANPAQPQTVTALKMTQTGERKVNLSWRWSSGAFNGFRVFAPGLPADGRQVTLQQHTGEAALEIPNVPEGPQQFRVAYQYGTKAAPIDARLTATVATWSGQYRAVLLGFRVGRKTVDDDILDGDGRGDEVFFAAYRALIAPDGAGTIAPLGVVQSSVYGDNGSSSARIRAGTAGPTGGIRSGDVIPSVAALAAQPGISASGTRLPLLLWQGGLQNDGAKAVIALTGFEWDNSSLTPFNSWANWWNAPNGRSGLQVSTRESLAAAPNEIRYIPLMLTYEVEADKPLIADRLALPPLPGTPKERRYLYVAFAGRPIGTRPLGALKGDSTQWYAVPHGFALTRRNIEAALGTARAVVVSAPLAMRRGPGASRPEEQDESEYTVYVQIERTSALPVAVP